MDIRKDLHSIILECLVRKPPEVVVIGDETLGGMADTAEMVVETILMKMESLFYTLLGSKIADGNWGIDDPTELYREVAMEYLEAIEQQKSDVDKG